MRKHLTLIRNKGSVIYYHNRGAPGIWGEHKILGKKKGTTQKFFVLKGGNRRFSLKGFSGFYPSLVLKSAQKPFLLNIQIIMKNFLATSQQKILNIFFNVS